VKYNYDIEKLRSVQAEVCAENPTDHYYTHHYNALEPKLWGDIPGWILADAWERTGLVVGDIGVAYGTLCSFLSDVLPQDTRVVAFDLDFRRFGEYMWKKRGIERYTINIEREEFPDRFNGVFDIIVMTEILEHFNFYPVPTMRRVQWLMKPGGKIYISTPRRTMRSRINHFSKMEHYDPEIHRGKPTERGHVHIFTDDELIELMLESGFDVNRHIAKIGHQLSATKV
jgi:2-polyprenyl-3-methyl-5-hydroxy-6-metoxy-1,4-benzoquinol methylase